MLELSGAIETSTDNVSQCQILVRIDTIVRATRSNLVQARFFVMLRICSISEIQRINSEKYVQPVQGPTGD